ncbi:MAG: NUDIX domain-containing protein [Candidatus Peribacteria bacterium]|nr:MAG: NUDIX domain-containing protein [Candidatus Peribacteria bacterium]
MTRLLQQSDFKVRQDMEIDPSFQQPIPYTIIWNPELQKVIAYKRSSDETIAGDQRLYGKWSIGVGGHIEQDIVGDTSPVETTALREIAEEAHITNLEKLELLGYINDNSDEVGRVHFGVVYLAITATQDATINDGEMEKVTLLSLEEIQHIIDSPDAVLESRSHLAFQYLKQYLTQH